MNKLNRSTWRTGVPAGAALLVAGCGLASFGGQADAQRTGPPVTITQVAHPAALLMVLAGVLTPRSAARALDWNVLFILAGSVGLAAIVVDSGLADVLARTIHRIAGGNLFLVVIAFATTTTIMTNLVTNAAAASILTPVALGIATDLGINPVTLLALIATCISFTFLNPFSHQSNLMVMEPGGYSTRTFAKFGTPLVVVCLAAAIAVAWAILA